MELTKITRHARGLSREASQVRHADPRKVLRRARGPCPRGHPRLAVDVHAAVRTRELRMVEASAYCALTASFGRRLLTYRPVGLYAASDERGTSCAHA